MIIVTGGAGFIGSNLAHTLLSNGNEVVVIDNFNIFNRYFPKYSKQYFIKLKKAIENYEIDNIHKYLKIIAAISGIVYTITNN